MSIILAKLTKMLYNVIVNTIGVLRSIFKRSKAMGEELKDIISRLNLIDKTFEKAKASIDDFICEEKEKASAYGVLSKDSVQYDLDMCSYNISNFGLDAERQCIEVRINYYCRNKYIGYYSTLYNPCNAEVIDDYIVIDF